MTSTDCLLDKESIPATDNRRLSEGARIQDPSTTF